MALSAGASEIRGCLLGQLHRGRLPCDPADLVANPIDHRLPQICLHGPDMPWFKLIEIGDNVEHCFLDKIVGIVFRARRLRQPAVRPHLERRQAPFHESLEGRAVAFAGSRDGPQSLDR